MYSSDEEKRGNEEINRAEETAKKQKMMNLVEDDDGAVVLRPNPATGDGVRMVFFGSMALLTLSGHDPMHVS